MEATQALTQYKIKRSYGKWFLSKVKRAIQRYEMIKPQDKILVGASGGKDSSALLYILWLLKNFSPLEFEFEAVFLDLGWGLDPAPLAGFCREHGIPFHVEPTVIKAIVFDYRREEHPCALCSHLRRGALNKVALRLGCNKVALGHHLDDLLETFLLNWLYNGRFSTFLPATYLTQSGLTVIRPLIYLREATVEALTRKENLPVLTNPCPAAGHTRRKEIKELVKFLATKYPYIRERFLTAWEAANGKLEVL
ncbi:tRNA(Ile)-lysidine synthase TilS/MesJ [Thermanaeromonas toyohensis ToBE]|uniref:tRNA(Ile)-lysidine synthase TilS/MesJ n=1 Tax=Thermanaeromonas toyohensis ToBE TaxID=698762 RepID=A0A1W1W2Z3_9FIRM|nr:tRNA 2-thiocytidine biosynthesis TtcA family protein [Thermanaeromonas toyohensis]SMB99987.1 tRNA(Ile)-lysidine synthase TilS/MesJ [Thermanaeromonas toyohensis ToBE]